MSTIHWKFEGGLASFTTESDKFDVTVAKMRQTMHLHPEHKTVILNATQSNSDSVDSRISTRHTKKSATVSSPAKPVEPQSETPELRDVPDFLDIDSDGSVPF